MITNFTSLQFIQFLINRYRLVTNLDQFFSKLLFDSSALWSSIFETCKRSLGRFACLMQIFKLLIFIHVVSFGEFREKQKYLGSFGVDV